MLKTKKRKKKKNDSAVNIISRPNRHTGQKWATRY